MTQERMKELMNNLIDYQLEGDKKSEVIETLFGLGFTGDELVENFNFSITDVREVATKTGIAEEEPDDLSEYFSIIEKKAQLDKNKAERKRIELEEKRNKALSEVESLYPRIRKLLAIANKCVEEGISLPCSAKCRKFGYGGGYFNFIADGFNHCVGFIEKRRRITEGERAFDYIGVINGGWCGDWDFYINENSTFMKAENDETIKPAPIEHLQGFLRQFYDFESAFYKWIESLKEE